MRPAIWSRLFLVVALATFGALAVPTGAAAPTSASVAVSDYKFTPSATTIAVGGTVSFNDPSGGAKHNVAFSSPAGLNCTGLPSDPSSSGWSGSCNFTAIGVYSYICDQHPVDMKGTVTVVDESTPGGPGGGGGGQSATTLVKVAKSQKGTTLRGTVTGALPGSKVVVKASAKRKALGGSGPKTGPAVVGKLTKTAAGDGSVSFKVKVNSKARSAIKRAGKLSISVRVRYQLTSGAIKAKTFVITLRRP